MTLDEIATLDFPRPVPRDKRHGIGVVGAGGIVNMAHLPAYKAAGFNVVAICDARPEAARQTAERFGIQVVCGSAEELIARPDVEIVDLAVTPDAQFELAPRAAAAGKHLLCQKPLGEDLARARQLVEAAERAGVLLAVNQQMRWSAAIWFARLLIERGAYGALTEAVVDVDAMTDWGWMGQRGRVEYIFSSIHYFDALRFLLGEPTHVLASAARYPGQTANAETRTFTILEYSETLRAIVHSNHSNWSGQKRALLRVHGTEGRSETTLGVRDNPVPSADDFAFTARSSAPWTMSRRFTESWQPDSFAYPMADLMVAIETGRAPLTAGRDNLKTLRLLEAAYRSIAEGRRVAPGEVG